MDWQSKFYSNAIAQPGFVSLEFLAPPAKSTQWIIVQRFATSHNSSSWSKSKEYKELFDDLRHLVVNQEIEVTISDESSLQRNVTEVIIAKVVPGKELVYREWVVKIHQIEAKFPGFCGIYVQPPESGKESHWVTFLQFDTIQNLDYWLESSERKQLLKEVAPLITAQETHRVISPYAGWFSSIAAVSEAPPVWKQTMIVLLMLFPLVMLEGLYLAPFFKGFNVSLSTFINNTINVTFLTFPLIPIGIKLLGWWLTPNLKKSVSITILGTFVVLLLYFIEIMFFWNLTGG